MIWHAEGGCLCTSVKGNCMDCTLHTASEVLSRNSVDQQVYGRSVTWCSAKYRSGRMSSCVLGSLSIHAVMRRWFLQACRTKCWHAQRNNCMVIACRILHVCKHIDLDIYISLCSCVHVQPATVPWDLWAAAFISVVMQRQSRGMGWAAVPACRNAMAVPPTIYAERYRATGLLQHIAETCLLQLDTCQ